MFNESCCWNCSVRQVTGAAPLPGQEGITPLWTRRRQLGPWRQSVDTSVHIVVKNQSSAGSWCFMVLILLMNNLYDLSVPLSSDSTLDILKPWAFCVSFHSPWQESALSDLISLLCSLLQPWLWWLSTISVQKSRTSRAPPSASRRRRRVTTRTATMPISQRTPELHIMMRTEQKNSRPTTLSWCSRRLTWADRCRASLRWPCAPWQNMAVSERMNFWFFIMFLMEAVRSWPWGCFLSCCVMRRFSMR